MHCYHMLITPGPWNGEFLSCVSCHEKKMHDVDLCLWIFIWG